MLEFEIGQYIRLIPEKHDSNSMPVYEAIITYTGDDVAYAGCVNFYVLSPIEISYMDGRIIPKDGNQHLFKCDYFARERTTLTAEAFNISLQDVASGLEAILPWVEEETIGKLKRLAGRVNFLSENAPSIAAEEILNKIAEVLLWHTRVEMDGNWMLKQLSELEIDTPDEPSP